MSDRNDDLRADRAAGMTYSQLSEKYGVSDTRIKQIVNNPRGACKYDDYHRPKVQKYQPRPCPPPNAMPGITKERLMAGR